MYFENFCTTIMAREVTKSAVDPRTVFLFSGQTVEQKVGSREGISSVVTQYVVIAKDAIEAEGLLVKEAPEFRSLGSASLADYEDAVIRLRAVAEGRSTEWPMLTE